MVNIRYIVFVVGAVAFLSGCVMKPATPEAISSKCDELRGAAKTLPNWCPPLPPPPPPPPPPGGQDRPPPAAADSNAVMPPNQ